MSLWDTDKNNSDRGAPQLNQKDLQAQKQASGVISLNPITDTTPGSVTTNTYGVFKIVKVMDLTLTFTSIVASPGNWQANVKTNTTAHSLDYVPTVFSFYNNNGFFIPLPITVFGVNGGNPSWATYDVSADTTNIYVNGRLIVYNGGVTGASYSIRVYVCKERPG
jgi:hypothetical protein